MGKVGNRLGAEQHLAMELQGYLRRISLLLLGHHTSKRRRIRKGHVDCRASVWFCEQSCRHLISLLGAVDNSILF